jgi:Na+-driven multidrug efflux pump
MILSRQIAKQRIAKNERPSFVAAWSLVLMDGALIFGLLALLWAPVVSRVMTPDAGVISYAILFMVFFVPSQAVLFIASLWAVMSRVQDDPQV